MNEALRQFDYPGRFLIIGKDGEQYVAIYGVTGRNPASCAKRYVQKGDKIVVESTDADVMASGDLSLLDYTAGRLFQNGVVLGNGRQTDNINVLDKESAAKQLAEDLSDIEYEHDKYCTPRITACMHDAEEVTLALHRAFANDEKETVRETFEVALEAGSGMFISTYAGPNVRPTPAFTDAPIRVELNFGSAQEAAEAFYNIFAPKEGEQDLRVSVVAVYYDPGTCKSEIYTLNTKESK